MPLKRYRTLPAQKVNPGIRAAYRRELDALVREMGRQAVAEILAEYDRLEWRIVPPVAQDAKWRSPVEVLTETANSLLSRWRKKFIDQAVPAAKKALKDIKNRICKFRERTLREIGFTVKIAPSSFTNNRYQALMLQNEHLISTIPDQFFGEMKTIIDGAIVKGLDRDQLAEQLYERFDPPSDKKWSQSRWHKHCKFIARDQTSKAVQALAESTDLDMGLTEGIWVHMPGRFESRLTHMAMGRDKTPFKLAEGKYDSAVGRKVKPAELYNCMCTYRTVIPDDWRA